MTSLAKETRDIQRQTEALRDLNAFMATPRRKAVSMIARDIEQAAQIVHAELSPFLPAGAAMFIRYQQTVGHGQGAFATERTLWSVTAYGGEVVVSVHKHAYAESTVLLKAATDAVNASRSNAGLPSISDAMERRDR